ncbi:pirin family protein, partial [Salmonella enterica]|uniref:pirin family protein n=1 Tax=Salmonella enterica TaxID=28901 RepID=UPI0022B748FF
MDHEDSLGTNQRVGPGGVQVMQAGSGMYHAEGFGKVAQGFQIWFEPNMRETIKNEPTYHQYDHEQFPLAVKNGVRVKTVIGD